MANVVEEDGLQLLRLGWCSEDLVFLERLQIVHVEIADDGSGLGQGRYTWVLALFGSSLDFWVLFRAGFAGWLVT